MEKGAPAGSFGVAWKSRERLQNYKFAGRGNWKLYYYAGSLCSG